VTQEPRWNEIYLLSVMRGVSFAGDIAAATAIALYLESRGGAAGFLVATLIAAAAPGVLLAPLTGPVADRFDSRTILFATAATQAVVCVIMALWLQPFAVVAFTAVLSAGLAFTHPVFGGLPLSMVGRDNVVRASSISQTSAMAGMLAAPAIAGLLVGSIGTQAALVFNAASFAAVAAGALVIQTRLHRTRSASAEPAREPDEPAVYSAWRDPFIRTLLAATGLVVTCVSINNVVAVYFVRDTLGASEQTYGILGSAWMAGLVVGSLLVGKNKKLSANAQIVMAYACMGLGLTLIATVSWVWIMVPFNFLAGIGNGTMATNLHVVLNLHTPERYRGRAFAALGAVSNAAPMTGYFLGGLLISVATPRASYAVIGLAALACTVAVGPALLRASGTARELRVEKEAV
jgi:MFS family permease